MQRKDPEFTYLLIQILPVSISVFRQKKPPLKTGKTNRFDILNPKNSKPGFPTKTGSKPVKPQYFTENPFFVGFSIFRPDYISNSNKIFSEISQRETGNFHRFSLFFNKNMYEIYQENI